MASSQSIKHLRMAAPTWIFVWRQPRTSLLRNGFIVLTVAGTFVVFLTCVHIRMVPLVPWVTHKAAVIQVADDAEGRALTLQAREGGPFPSRFDPTAWDGAAALEQSAFEVARWRPPPHVPNLRELPERANPSVKLALQGESTLPEIKPELRRVPVFGKLKLAPVLSPLSGNSSVVIPMQLPIFEHAVDAKLTDESWRFLLRLDRAGMVQDCVSLGGGDETGAPLLEAWLRRVTFNIESGKASAWIAVGVAFTNQPADGPESP